MPSAPWSTIQLAEFLEVFEVIEMLDADKMTRIAIDRVAAALDAEVVALLKEDSVVRCLGFQPDSLPVKLLRTAASVRFSEVDAPGIGPAHSVSAAVSAAGCRLVVMRAADPFDKEEEMLIRSMAKALGLAMTATDRLTESRELAERLSERQYLGDRLSLIQQSISHRAPLQEVMDSITQGGAELLGVDVVGLRIVGLGERSGPIASLAGFQGDGLEAFRDIPLHQGFSGRAFLEGELVSTHDFSAEFEQVGLVPQIGIEAAMAAPVQHDGRIVGILNVASRVSGRQFTPAEQEVLLRLADHASLAVTDAEAVHVLRDSLEGERFKAGHDALTALPNRSSVLEMIEYELRGATSMTPLCVLYVDVDRFKLLNDMHGHFFGDLVLVEVANRLRSTVREEDLVGRLAGDEFVVVAPGISGQAAEALAERIVQTMSEPLLIQGRSTQVTLSVGVAESLPSLTSESLLSNADVAMYRAKTNGRDSVVRYDTQMREEMFQRADLEHEITLGLKAGEFVPFFQPSVDLATERIDSLEALVRWNHPTRGELSPAAFLELAEETGLIIELDKQVLDEACRRLAGWTQTNPELTLSVNLSVRHFANTDIVDFVAATLAKHRLHGSRLWLEITESMVMANNAMTLDILRSLRSLGVRFMVDDFGTGYSSLVYLKRYPINALKVDREFVDGLGVDLEDEAIVTAIIRLAEALGHEVIAEGVETEVQKNWLLEAGCLQAQGFLFSKPLSGDDLDLVLLSSTGMDSGLI
ncbi:MAG: EAL domain-containing protein [Actinobacteria bacterium]|nr:EAL domain-containing protein [Actinomycetota bacterium]MTA64466.1 EAL domain-containing protein [Actinomycetota bacterium]